MDSFLNIGVGLTAVHFYLSVSPAASPEWPFRRASPEGPWCWGFLGSPGGKNKNMDNFLAKRHTGESASGIRRLDESPVRRFAGIAGPLDNDIQPVPLTRDRVPPATREPSVDACPPANPTHICDPLSCNP